MKKKKKKNASVVLSLLRSATCYISIRSNHSQCAEKAPVHSRTPSWPHAYWLHNYKYGSHDTSRSCPSFCACHLKKKKKKERKKKKKERKRKREARWMRIWSHSIRPVIWWGDTSAVESRLMSSRFVLLKADLSVFPSPSSLSLFLSLALTYEVCSRSSSLLYRCFSRAKRKKKKKDVWLLHGLHP